MLYILRLKIRLYKIFSRRLARKIEALEFREKVYTIAKGLTQEQRKQVREFSSQELLRQECCTDDTRMSFSKFSRSWGTDEEKTWSIVSKLWRMLPEK